MSLFLDIGTGAGLAGASGVRPFLPPLLAGALARGDVGIDFDGTDWSFLESPAFLAAVLALGLGSYALDRTQAGRQGERRSPATLGLLILGAVLGALLFAGALADGGHAAGIGLVAGPLCALLAGVAVGGVVERARRRLDAGAAGLLTVYADTAALVLAAVAVFVPPLSFVALIGFVVLLLGSRRREGEKYAGLRVLR
jgi:peptidoglycan/LPS O-acetylase OafA/YrhL